MPDEAFRLLVEDLLRLTASSHPVPPGGPDWSWPPPSLGLEARLRRQPGHPLLWDLVVLGLKTLMASLLVRFDIRAGNFVPSRYRTEIVANTDFRKFGDGLMMTIDCSVERADAVEERLAAAEAAGVAHFGMHRQAAALMTCVVPSPSHPGHIHFIDGAGGGYTLAARQLKERRTARVDGRTSGARDAAAPTGATL